MAKNGLPGASRGDSRTQLPNAMRQAETADEIFARLGKLEALCAVQTLLVQEGLHVSTKYQVGMAQLMEDQLHGLRDCLCELLD
jgi:hypothetical protein